ncbi:hypothetical protein [Deinococcus pimensis]|uniref:hypothetical protein n=1 Tax=Deinococcus pimensis TaxID=309888 RepID=UPI0004882F55|nr:hypothetical protein [Deinococcus pimensis]
MELTRLDSLAALLGAARERLPVFVVSGKLPGEPWGVTYHAGHGVDGTVVARALLESEDAVVASVRRARGQDLAVAHLSWRWDPHFPLLHHDFPAGASWSAQAALVGTFPIFRTLRDAPEVRSALDAFATFDVAEWRFRGARVLPRENTGRLVVYAADSAALAALTRPLLLMVPDALVRDELPPERTAPDPRPPPVTRRRVPRGR